MKDKHLAIREETFNRVMKFKEDLEKTLPGAKMTHDNIVNYLLAKAEVNKEGSNVEDKP